MPDKPGGVNDKDIDWEQDLRPFTRLPRAPRETPRQATPAWIPALVSVALVLLVCGAAASFVNANRPAKLNIGLAPTATFAIATAVATERIPPTATPWTAPTNTPIPSPTPVPTGAPGTSAIRIGGYVKIINTGPTGLNFRKEPAVGGERIRGLPEGNVYEVVGGPANASDLIWWQLKDTDGVTGWGAASYMQPVAKP